MQNNCRQNWYYTPVKNSKINETLTFQTAVFFFPIIYINIYKKWIRFSQAFFDLSRKALNLQGKIDLNETMLLFVLMT